jgi:hypothetical protein
MANNTSRDAWTGDRSPFGSVAPPSLPEGKFSAAGAHDFIGERFQTSPTARTVALGGPLSAPTGQITRGGGGPTPPNIGPDPDVRTNLLDYFGGSGPGGLVRNAAESWNAAREDGASYGGGVPSADDDGGGTNLCGAGPNDPDSGGGGYNRPGPSSPTPPLAGGVAVPGVISRPQVGVLHGQPVGRRTPQPGESMGSYATNRSQLRGVDFPSPGVGRGSAVELNARNVMPSAGQVIESRAKSVSKLASQFKPK